MVSGIALSLGESRKDWSLGKEVWYCYHSNPTGSTAALTDMSGSVVNSYAYDPFGVPARNETVPQPFMFVGQYGVMFEPEDIYYMRARYYDPNVGRFISEDPLGFGGGDVNLFAYVTNNPVSRIDPFGLYTEVLVWQPVGYGKSAFGHVSVNLNGTSYSFSPNGMDVRPIDEYMQMNTNFRGGVGAVVDLSPDQEALLKKAFDDPGKYGRISNNCGNPVQSGLRNAGVDIGSSVLPISFLADLMDSGSVSKYNFYPAPSSK